MQEETRIQLVQAAQMISRRGEEQHFTGTVWLHEVPHNIPTLIDVRVALVFFEPGARTNWHTHPEGQILYVVAGHGRVSDESGNQRHEINPGDSISIAPGKKHWHGAGPNSFMVHLAITPDKATCWMDPVSEEDYKRGFEG